MSYNVAALKDLRERVRSIDRPESILNLDIARALVPDVVCLRFNRENSQNEAYVHLNYTASIDAALALVERVLPGWTYFLTASPQKHDRFYACLHEEWDTKDGEWHDGSTLPLALLDALLSALIPQSEGGG